jgi:hypothetical protein
VTGKVSDVILEARPISDALTEGVVSEDGELLEDGAAIPFGEVEQELLRAFGADVAVGAAGLVDDVDEKED